MIRFYTGKPRSGKTYHALHDIVNDFLSWKYFDPKKKDKTKSYKRLYTNIALNPDFIENANFYFEYNNVEKKIYPLKWNIFFNHINKLYDLAVTQTKSDHELLEYLDSHNLSNSLIVIDEAHNYFDKTRSSALVWFLGYHGHMKMDLWFITQNKSKMHSDYTKDCEIFIDAQPMSKSLSNRQMRYFYYGSDKYTKDQRYDVKSLFKDDRIYSIYHSGDIHKPSKIVYKVLIFLAFAVVFAIYNFYSLFANFGNRKDINATQKTNHEKNHDSQYSALSIFALRCDDDRCWNPDPDYKSKSYQVGYIFFILSTYEYPILYSEFSNQIGDLKQKTYYVNIPKKHVEKYFPNFLKKYEEEKKQVSLMNNAIQTAGAQAAEWSSAE